MTGAFNEPEEAPCILLALQFPLLCLYFGGTIGTARNIAKN
jgi:hypothetical protein